MCAVKERAADSSLGMKMRYGLRAALSSDLGESDVSISCGIALDTDRDAVAADDVVVVPL